MKLKLLIIAAFFVSVCKGQVDVFNYEVVTIGASIKSLQHQGFYINYNDFSHPAVPVDKFNVLSDGGTSFNLDIDYLKFEKNNFQSYSLNGLIYVLSYFGNMNSNHNGDLGYALMPQFTTTSNNLKDIYRAIDPKLTDQSRFFNLKFFDSKVSFGKKNISVGFNFAIHSIGIRGPFTWFIDNKGSNVYYSAVNNGPVGKLLGGPNIAYRKTINNLSIIGFAGVNFCPNLSAIKNYKIKYNPFIDFQVIFGKKVGIVAGIKYELINGTNMVHTETNFVNKDVTTICNISQLEFKLAFYYKAGWFRKLLKKSKN